MTRVPDLHLIDAVISPEEKQLLRKDGLDSCALRSGLFVYWIDWIVLSLFACSMNITETIGLAYVSILIFELSRPHIAVGITVVAASLPPRLPVFERYYPHVLVVVKVALA